MKIKFTLEYNGKNFSGFQAQPGFRTVEGEFRSALNIFFASEFKKKGLDYKFEETISPSGRTDAGVHAKGQVLSLIWPDVLSFDPHRVIFAFNGIAPADLSVLGAEIVPDTFDARFSPHQKCYKYYLKLRRARSPLDLARYWHIYYPIDLSKAIAAAKEFKGTHDFKAFRAADCQAKTTVRTIIDSQLVRISEDELVYTVIGKGFLKNMVRIMAGTLVEIGRGSVTHSPSFLLKEGRRELAGETAPAYGLCLEWVKY
jgi:tRNA pseudouridine38-40 synthase